MKWLMIFHDLNTYANAPQYYVSTYFAYLVWNKINNIVLITKMSKCVWSGSDYECIQLVVTYLIFVK